jgi:diguanylate cyclase (GGDEF)-like protein
MDYSREELILEQNKRIIDLEKENNEKSSFLWVFGEIVKYSSKLKSEKELASLILDMLIGIFGLQSCSISLKQENNQYNIYTINNELKNKFKMLENQNIDEKFRILKKVEMINRSDYTVVYLPIYNYMNDEQIGFLSAKSYNNFFNKTKIDFFETLTVQLSNIFINSRMHKKIMELSNKDILTSCYNRRYLDDLKHYHDTQNITYILIDLDNFKTVNDTLGHEQGDELLINIASLALDFFEKYHGRVIRYGGDEFIVILEKNYKESLKLLKIFKDIFLHDAFLTSFKVDVTASFGIANYPEHANSLDSLLNKADRALYFAKESGRNQIRSFTEISRIVERT